MPAHAGAATTGSALVGNESQQLARLRARERRGTQACRLNQPSESRDVRSSSHDSGDLADVDDLDVAAKQALTRLQLPDFRVPVSRRALNYVRFLTRTRRGRGMFEAWLKRSGRYQDMVQQQLRERHLPEDLIWLAMIESGFDATAKSPAGATGLWQFMRATGAVYDLRVTRHVDERKNPAKATVAAVHHLRDLYQRFGDWALAMAAYNMGYEQLLNRIDRYGTSDFNELSRQRALPSETTSYVPKIVAAALVANNLERYGFADVKPYKPRHTAELTVPGGTPLKTLAKAAGVSRRTLRRLNPHLLRDYVPPGSGYTVYVPPETLSRARAALPVMLDRRNALTDADILAPDVVLGFDQGRKKRARHRAWDEGENLLRFLPTPKRLKAKKRRRALRDGQYTAGDRAVEGLAAEFGPRRSDREVVMYRVGSGDTLIGIAREFAIDIEDLARDNGLDNQARLREGALLRLSVKRGVLDGRLPKKKSVKRKKSEQANQDVRSGDVVAPSIARADKAS